MRFRIIPYLMAALGLALLALSPAFAQTAGADPYQALVTRDYGTADAEMMAVEKEVESATPDQRPAVEAKLIAVLNNPAATMPGKQFVCQMLRIIGSDACIPSVAKLLGDEKLSHMARLVLQALHDPAADAALLQGLGQAQGNLKIGIIATLGDRHDEEALQALAPLLAGTDAAQAKSALNAVAKIGGVQGADTLAHAQVADSLKPDWARAYLRVAGELDTAGNTARSGRMFRSLLDGDYPSSVRAGALRGFAFQQKENAVPLIMKSLSSTDVLMKRAAVETIVVVPGHAMTAALGRQLEGLPAEGKVALLGPLASRGDSEGLTDPVNKLVGDNSPEVRKAAVRALAKLGNASSVPVLVAALKDEALDSDATKALLDIRGDGVVQGLIQQVDGNDAAIRPAVITILAQRGDTEALPSVRKALADNDPRVRSAALDALAVFGTQDDLQQLTNAVLTQKDDGERDHMGRAMASIGHRLPDKSTRCDYVLAALDKADSPAKVVLLTVVSTLGGDKALAAVRAGLTGDDNVHKAALRGLSNWPDPTPMPDLLAIAKNDTDKTNRILALRGYITMVGMFGMPGMPGLGNAAKVADYKQALDLAERPDEKRQVLAGLGMVFNVDSLKTIEPFLDDPGLKREAYISYEKVAEELARPLPSIAREALQKVVDNSPNGESINKAREALRRIR